MQIRITIIAIFCSVSCLCAQQPLSVGDAVPDTVFDTVLNHNSPRLNLSDFKEKLVILDFWATWCASCLRALPKLDSLQSLFGSDLKLLLVNNKSTGDDSRKIKAFLNRWQQRTGRPLNLTMIVGDTLTEKLFPHRLIPHYAWIDKNGKLFAITASDAVTAQHIRSVLNGGEINLAMKKDQNTERPLFLDKDLPSQNLLSYSILLKGWYDGLPSGNRYRVREGKTCGRAITNTALADIFLALARKLDTSFTSKQLLIQKADSAELCPPSSAEERQEWFKQHAFSMDVLLPPGEASNLYLRMLQLLNQGSGYTGRFRHQKIQCLVLACNGYEQPLKSKGGRSETRLSGAQPFLQNGRLSVLVNYLNQLKNLPFYVVDESGITGAVDLSFNQPFTDLASVKNNLLKYGLHLRQQERTVKVFAISKTQIRPAH